MKTISLLLFSITQLSFFITNVKTMEIGISKCIEKNELQKHLCDLLNSKSICVSDDIEDVKKEQDYFVLTTDTDYKNFSFGIGFYKFIWSEEKYEYMLQQIAESIGIKFNCQCFTDAGEYAPDQSPYWLLLWDGCGWYLATEYTDNNIENDNNGEKFELLKVKFIAKTLLIPST